MENVLTEVMQLFPGKWIHTGGDEAVKTQWKTSPLAQQRIKALGLKDEDALQGWFTTQIDAFLAAHGRTLVGWDEILDGGLSPNAVVMSWRGIDGGIAAAQAGHDAVMAPGQYTYFDHYQSGDRDTEPLAIGGFLPLDSVYSYDPVPAALTPDQAKHILGAQGQVWTEYLPGFQACGVHGLPEARGPVRGAVDPPGGQGISRRLLHPAVDGGRSPAGRPGCPVPVSGLGGGPPTEGITARAPVTPFWPIPCIGLPPRLVFQSVKFHDRLADVAQLVEQRFCKPPVPGSSPVVSSRCRRRGKATREQHTPRGYPRNAGCVVSVGQRGRDVGVGARAAKGSRL